MGGRECFRARLEKYWEDLSEWLMKFVFFVQFLVVFAVVLRIAEWTEFPEDEGNIFGYAAASIVGLLLLAGLFQERLGAAILFLFMCLVILRNS